MTSETGKTPDNGLSRRKKTRLTTVYGGRLCQLGKVYPCVISDVSESGAKVRLKDKDDLAKMDREEPVQIIIDRLGEYKSLRATVAWDNQSGATLGLLFTDDIKVRHMVISKLMPNRWQLLNSQSGSDENAAEG